MRTLIILSWLMLIPAIIGTLMTIICVSEFRDSHNWKHGVKIFLGIILVGTSIIGVSYTTVEKTSRLCEMAASEYTVFVDGQKMDTNNVDLTKYDWSINEDQKSILLTRKQPRTAVYIPVIH